MRTLFLSLILTISSLFAVSAQWTQCNGPIGGTSNILAIKNKTIISSSGYAELFLSNNNGKNWTNVFYNFQDYIGVNNIHIGDDNIFVGTNFGLVYTSDNGKTWDYADINNKTNVRIYSLESRGDIVYAGTEDNGIFRSTDKGKTWLKTNDGLHNMLVGALEISGENIFAGTIDGVYLSTNNGDKWTRVNNGIKSNTVIYALAATELNIFASTSDGIFTSSDNGKKWTKVREAPSEYEHHSIAVSGKNVFAGAKNGVYVSTNNGETWTAVNNGLTNTEVLALSSDGDRIIVGTNGAGVFTSDSNGNDWLQLPLINISIGQLEVSGNTIYAGTIEENGYRVLRSTDNGESWNNINNGLTATMINSLMLKDQYVFAGTNHGVFITDSKEVNWEKSNTGLTDTSVYCLMTHEDNIFLGCKNGVFVSTDNGNSWKQSGLENISVKKFDNTQQSIYASTDLGIYMSKNDGKDWLRITDSFPSTSTMSFALKGSDIILGVYSIGIYTSSNNGGSWREVTNDLTNLYMNQIMIFGDNIFVMANGSLYLSTDNCEHWRKIIIDSSITYVTDLATNNQHIFAGTWGNSVWKLDLSTLSSAEEQIYNHTELSLSPNPNNGILYISLHNENTDIPLSVEIFSMQGEKIIEYTTEQNSFTLDINHLSTGMYYVIARSGNYSTRQMLSLVK